MELFAFIVAAVIATLIALKIIVYCIFVLTILLFDRIKINKYKKLKKSANEQNFELTEQNYTLKSKSIFSKFKNLILRYYDGVYKYMVKKVAFLPSHKIRKFLYRHLFHVKIGKRVTIYYGLEIRCGFKISIGNGTIIGDNCILDGRCGLEIGENVNLSSDVCVWTLQHDVNDSYFKGKGGSVKINDRAWISSNTVILPNICVGEGSVLACGAVATKDLDDYKIYAGIPAKEIGVRNSDLKYEFDGKSCWFY